ncbi:ABC transporter substrate-binding protein [Changpingibacter yushuensis]|uniref:ABC transporter substrate-binding protein n=1 Tax=Changpingibacter yushuensis TaxID=2758440 RepID=UPI00165E9BF1|nr:ABC transporter substrate-binding protein [Changpingibacter yushuensis]
MSVPRIRLVLALAAVTAFGVGACAPSSSSGLDATSSAGSDTVDDVTIALPGSLSTLDVAQEAGSLNYQIATITSEGLLGVNADGELVPALAEAWSQPDATTYVFSIRQDAKFTDGTPVTVDDILFSIDLARDPDRSPSTSIYWPEGLTVEQTGDWEITFTLAEANVAFAWTPTAVGGLWVTSRSFYENAGTYGSSADLILGTGAYEVVEFQPDSHVTFRAVDTWWGGTPDVKEIDVEFIPDENTRLLAQQSGETDISLGISLDQSEHWDSIAGSSVEYVSDRSYVGLTFDASVEPFDDIHVRKAVAHALDRESIVSTVLHGKGEVATGLSSPAQLGSSIGEDKARELLSSLTTFDFDLTAAKAELAQSKVPNGFDLELTYPNSGPQLGQAALTLADNLSELGINLSVTEVPIEEWISKVGTGDYGLYYMWYLPTTGDPGEIPGWLLNPGNPAQYENDEVFSHMASSSTDLNDLTRAESIIAANEIAQADVAYAPAWWGVSATAFTDNLTPQDYTAYFFMTPWAASLTSIG